MPSGSRLQHISANSAFVHGVKIAMRNYVWFNIGPSCFTASATEALDMRRLKVIQMNPHVGCPLHAVVAPVYRQCHVFSKRILARQVGKIRVRPKYCVTTLWSHEQTTFVLIYVPDVFPFHIRVGTSLAVICDGSLHREECVTTVPLWHICQVDEHCEEPRARGQVQVARDEVRVNFVVLVTRPAVAQDPVTVHQAESPRSQSAMHNSTRGQRTDNAPNCQRRGQ